jgi:hypothetical protein
MEIYERTLGWTKPGLLQREKAGKPLSQIMEEAQKRDDTRNCAWLRGVVHAGSSGSHRVA